MGERFAVEILAVHDDTIHVTFPAADYPRGGMGVDLEFHDSLGYATYHGQVLSGPRKNGDGVLLQRTFRLKRIQHRKTWRVPVDLLVRVKDRVGTETYPARLIDISSGGALLETKAPFNFHTTIEIEFCLPGQEPQTALSRVLHIAEGHGGTRRFGVFFIGLPEAASRAITTYVWSRLRALASERAQATFYGPGGRRGREAPDAPATG